MKLILLFVLVASFTASVGLYHLAHRHPHFVLEFQLMGKNVEAPELDAKGDIEADNIYCYSIGSYARSFPGVKDAAQINICNQATEKEFFGDSCIIASERHSKALDAAVEYALRYNSYVLSHIATLKI
ncbi:hypothetical protein [Allohahella sp. A8]|uniref:hypothetical protein n=1 Tax=Allohahella sp. A8 TaxID=3141461 RepID=UPI003A801CAE